MNMINDEKAIEEISKMILEMEYPNGVYHLKPFSEDERKKHLALYKAKDALSERTDRDNPKPLTLDELREMGKTDWVWLTFPELPSEESGWEESRGCNMEVDYARRIGLPIKTIGEDYETTALEEHKA